MVTKTQKYSLKQKRVSRKVAGKYTMIVFIGIVAILWLIPFLLMLNTSFKDNLELYTSKFGDIVNKPTDTSYKNAVDAIGFPTSLIISIVVTLLSNITIIFFSSLAAWQLARSKTWYSKAIFYTILVTMIVPFQAIMIPLMNVMGNIHLANIPGLIVMYTGFGMGISIFMMHGFLKGVPAALEEAAKVEGYNPIRVYFKVILPILKPIIVTVVLLNTMWIWNDFLLPYLVHIQNPESPTTMPVKLNIGLIGTYGTQINSLMAGLTIMIIPAVAFFVIMQKQIISGITNGAVK